MTRIPLLAWRHLTHHWGRSLILVASVALTFVLPVAVEIFVGLYGDAVVARAAATPLIVGAKGSRYDLVLTNLYFRGRVPATTSMGEVDALREAELGTPLPLLARRRAQGYPVVGTTPEYYEFRALATRSGSLPLRLGDTCIGAVLAQDLGLQVGDTLLTDRSNTYDMTLGYPLRLRVVGVLGETGTADDRAAFVDLKTAWIVEGIGHGHADAEQQDETRVLARADDGIVLDSGVVEYTEITDDNVDSFHFHESADELPLTGIVFVPASDRARTILKGRYRVSPDAQAVEPREVVTEIMGLVLRLKRFYDANVLFVSAATTLFLVLIVLLSLRVRQREMQALVRIGCARGVVFRLIATELLLLVSAGVLVAMAGGGALVLAFSNASPV